MKNKIVFAVLVLVAVGSIFGWSRANEKVLHYVAELNESKAVVEELERQPAVKIAALKQDLLARLKKCETMGKTSDDAPIILDTNNEMSIGELMFQIKTVQYYYKKLYAKEITRKEAVLVALDHDKAFALAHDIVFTDGKGIGNWHNCDKKNGFSSEIAIIKKLQ